MSKAHLFPPLTPADDQLEACARADRVSQRAHCLIAVLLVMLIFTAGYAARCLQEWVL